MQHDGNPAALQPVEPQVGDRTPGHALEKIIHQVSAIEHRQRQQVEHAEAHADDGQKAEVVGQARAAPTGRRSRRSSAARSGSSATPRRSASCRASSRSAPTSARSASRALRRPSNDAVAHRHHLRRLARRTPRCGRPGCRSSSDDRRRDRRGRAAGRRARRASASARRRRSLPLARIARAACDASAIGCAVDAQHAVAGAQPGRGGRPAGVDLAEHRLAERRCRGRCAASAWRRPRAPPSESSVERDAALAAAVARR